MQNLKVMMMTLIMCLMTMVSFGQSLKNNVFYITFETGVGEKIDMEFNVDSVSILKIQETENFKNWVTTTFSNPENAGYIEKWKYLSHIEMFLMGITNMASFYAKFELKNRSSYTPINGTSFIRCNDGKITVVFPMKGQNGYGNFIMSQAFYVLEWVDGKEKKFNFISSN
jgi:hypothetical protein